MSQEIVLYDLASRAPLRSFSGNAWKTRLALNFKGIPYRTEWVLYTRLQETLRATGMKPNPPGSWADYTVPTIRCPNGSYLMDSAAIAEKLEALYPSPSLHLNAELENEAQAAIGEVFLSLVPYLLPLGLEKVVAPEDVEWFKADRASRFGVTVEELVKGKDADEAFAAAKPGIKKCTVLLTSRKKDAGPFILGSEPCYADFYLVATMHMFSLVGEEVLERFLKEVGSEMRAMYEASGSWLEKQD